MRFLSPKVHGFVDYALVLLLALAPSLFGFATTSAATLCYVLAAAQLGMSLCTAYPLGIARIVPFPIHGYIEAATAVFLVFSPWLLGFSDVPAARNFFLVSAIALAGVFMVTNYQAAERPMVRRGVDLRTGSPRPVM